MDKITIIIIALILLLPFVYSLNEENYLSCGIYEELEIDCFDNAELSFLGKLAEEPSVSEEPAPPLSQGTNCDALSDANKRCYYLNASEGTCVLGCPPNNYCDETYRCQKEKIITKIIKETLLETTKEKTKVIIAIGLVILVIGVAFISEEEHRKKKLLLAGKKEEEEERKKNQKKLPKVEKSEKEMKENQEKPKKE